MRLLLVTMLLHFDLRLTEESKNWSDQEIYTVSVQRQTKLSRNSAGEVMSC